MTGPPAVTRAGWLIDDVNRVGDPVGIVAPDGLVHTGAVLLADARSPTLPAAHCPGCPAPAAVTVAPAHWRPAAVDAMGRACGASPDGPSSGWCRTMQPADRPARRPRAARSGVVAICDLGATGTTLTLIDAGNGMALIGEPVRYPDFSGKRSTALLTHVLQRRGVAPGSTGTSALKALTRLRDGCRQARERLSAPDGDHSSRPAGRCAGDIRITRPELDAIIREQLTGVVDTFGRSCPNGIAPGTSSPSRPPAEWPRCRAVTTTLSEHLHLCRSSRPAARLSIPRPPGRPGGQAFVCRRGRTVVTPVRRGRNPRRPRRWHGRRPAMCTGVRSAAFPPVGARPRPKLDFMREPVAADSRPTAWYRQPLVLAAAVVAIVAGAGAATAWPCTPMPPPSRCDPGERGSQRPSRRPAHGAPGTVVALPGPASAAAPARGDRNRPRCAATSPGSAAPAAEAVPAAEPPPVVEATPATESAPVPQVATEASAPPPLVIRRSHRCRRSAAADPASVDSGLPPLFVPPSG